MPSPISIGCHKALKNQPSEQEINALFDFSEFCVEKLGLNGPVIIRLHPKITNGKVTTGNFDLRTNKIICRYEGRALVDILRTIAHELIHQKQKEYGEFDNPERVIPDIGGEIEDEANAVAGQLIKMFAKEKNAKYIYEI